MLECVLSTQKNNYLYHNGERFCFLFESGSECSLFNALDVDKVSSKLEGPRFSKTITSYGLGSAGCTQYQTSVSSGSDKFNQNHELNKYFMLSQTSCQRPYRGRPRNYENIFNLNCPRQNYYLHPKVGILRLYSLYSKGETKFNCPVPQ